MLLHKYFQFQVDLLSDRRQRKKFKKHLPQDNLEMFISSKLDWDYLHINSQLENYHNYLVKYAIKYFIFAKTSIHIISTFFHNVFAAYQKQNKTNKSHFELFNSQLKNKIEA
jgi:hypothetical protein